MPIEFRCHQCDKLLRVGDDTAGKQAKCPNCGTVQQIPAASPAPTEASAQPLSPAAASAGNPFGAAPTSTASPGGEQNPYQSPLGYPAQDAYGSPAGTQHAAPLQRTPINVGDVLTRTWELYKAQMGICIGGVVLCGVINYIPQFISQMINAGMQAAVRDVAAIFAVNLLLFAIQVAFQTWIGIGQTMLLLKVARGETPSIGIVFEGGRYLARTILASLLFAVGVFTLMLLCAIPATAVYFATREIAPSIAVFLVIYACPAIYLALTFMQYFYLIVDRDLGPVEALSASREITRGNKLSIFGILLIGVLLNFAGIMLCCVGAIVTGPYVMLSLAVMYLTMSGGLPAMPFRR